MKEASVGKGKIKVPKRIFGFKLSKGTRKDLRKLMRMVEHPDKRALAITVGTGLATFLAERFTERQLEHVQDRRRTASPPGPMDTH
jgi:hypothetical protein